jgi:hypothetical protein
VLRYVKIFCFYETVAVDAVGFIVPEESAMILLYSNCGINTNYIAPPREERKVAAGP